MKEFSFIQTVLRIFLFLTISLPATAKTITIGTISDEPYEEIREYLPLAQYLAGQLASDGITGGKVLITKSIDETAHALREGKLDVFFDSPFPSIAVQNLARTKFLLRRWKKGVEKYHSVIFVLKDSGIKNLQGLKGKIFAFEEPFSTSGYLIPKKMLTDAGIRLASKSDTPPLPNEVAYVFSGEDENTMLWVLKGKASGGTMDNYKFEEEAKGDRNRLMIIASSPWFPRHIVSCRTDLPPQLVTRIKEVLVQMDRSEEGRKVLEVFEKTKKFDEIPPEALKEIEKYRTEMSATPQE